MTLNKYLSVWLRLSSFYTFIILWRCGRCAWWVVLKKGGNFFGWEKKEFLPILVGDFELGREEHPLISKSGVSQLWFNRGVCSSFFRDLNAVIRVDVYFGQTGEEGRPVSYGRWRFYGSCQLLEGYRKPLYRKFPFGISAKAAGRMPSAFSGEPVVRMIFHLDLFSRSSVSNLRLSFSLDRAKQVHLRVANLVSMSLSEVSMCWIVRSCRSIVARSAESWSKSLAIMRSSIDLRSFSMSARVSAHR